MVCMLVDYRKLCVRLLVMYNIDVYCDIAKCLQYKIIYYILSLDHIIHNVTAFALLFGFLKMSDCMGIVSEESKILQIFNN